LRVNSGKSTLVLLVAVNDSRVYARSAVRL
jgi:hypothetical protein